MDRQTVIARLRPSQDQLRQTGVSHLFLFGSVARQQVGQDSDVDLFFDTDNPRFSLIERIDVQDRIQQILQDKTGVMTRTSLHPRLRARIEAEAVPVF
jgi:predicted nucleotidyltransferase